MATIRFLIILISISFTLTTKIDYSNSAQLTWGGVCVSNTNQQSPIDIMTNSPDYMINNNFIDVVTTNYPNMQSVERVTATKDHFNMESDDVTKGSFTMTKDGDQYTFGLINMHIHCGSEHRINNKQYPCEIHLVHSRTVATSDKDQVRSLLVVGLLIEESTTANPLFEGDSMDFSSLVTEKTKFYYYEGGLTTPGCTQSVNWFVRQDAVTASKAQLDALKNWVATEYPASVNTNGNARNFNLWLIEKSIKFKKEIMVLLDSYLLKYHLLCQY